MTPVERIIEAERRAWDDWPEPIDLSNVEQVMRHSAVEILKAIREPSEAMIEAGALAFADAAFECGKPSKEALRHAWQVMIDKALSET